MTITDTIVSAEPAADETEFAREGCALMSHNAVVSVGTGVAILRIHGHGARAVYLGVTPDRAVRLGAALVRAGLRIDPKLSLQTVSDAVDSERAPLLRAVETAAS